MSKEPKRFKQTEIGELPEEWEVVRLGEVCKTASGGTPNRKEHKFFGGGIPWVKSSELKDTVILETEETLSEEGLKHSSAKIFPKGTVVVAMYGATVGRTGILGIDAATNQACCAFFPDPNLLDKMFLFFWLQYVRPVLARQSVGAAQPNISQQILRQLPIPLPPLEEQKRIAGVLRLVDRVAEETKRIINIYEKAKKFALKHLLTRGIGHTRFKQTEIGELPEEWEVVRLGDVARVFAGSSAPQKREYFENGIFPFVRVQDLARYGQTRCLREVADKVNERAVQEHHMVLARKGTIVFPKSGAALEKNHRAILGVDAYIVSHLAAVEANPEKVSNEFLFWWLCRVDMASLNPNPGYPSIRLEEIKALPIPLPSLEEQKQIAEMLSTIDAAIENERKYLRVLEKCKKWLLDNLLTGKVRLPPEVDEILKGVLPDAL